MVMEGDRLLPHCECLIVALDFSDAESALRMADTLAPVVSRFKVGLQLFSAAGMSVVKKLRERGASVFLDLKMHDIPNTVKAALGACVQPGILLVDVHAAGGRRMLEAAVEGVEQAAMRQGLPRPMLLGVTILTHMQAADLIEVGFGEPKVPVRESNAGNGWVRGHVRQLARLCQEVGLDGVVASPLEIQAIREETGPGFRIVTPGIRQAGADMDDQARVATPMRAMRAGASYIVVGRPITAAPDPLEAARAIVREMEDAFLIA